MRPGDRAWLALAAGVIAYEIVAPPDELLSEACDRARHRAPIVTCSTIVYFAAHLLRLWPRRIDPLTQMTTRLGR